MAAAATLPLEGAFSFYRAAFAAAGRLEASDFAGTFDGLVLGPAWFRPLFRAMMNGGGLAGWRGKRFGADGEGANLCLRGGVVREVAPMYVAGTGPSLLDGVPTLLLRYRGASFRRFIQDEVRAYDAETVIGMTYYDLPGTRRVVMPFGLRRK